MQTPNKAISPLFYFKVPLTVYLVSHSKTHPSLPAETNMSINVANETRLPMKTENK